MLAEYNVCLSEIEMAREEAGLGELEAERDRLKGEIDALVIDNDLVYEDAEIRIIRVQSHKRVWNIDKLESIMPRALFRRVIKMTVDGDKLDQLVREGKVDDKKIAPAYEETPNKAYAKWTPKSAKADGSDEAASLAEKLK